MARRKKINSYLADIVIGFVKLCFLPFYIFKWVYDFGNDYLKSKSKRRRKRGFDGRLRNRF